MDRGYTAAKNRLIPPLYLRKIVVVTTMMTEMKEKESFEDLFLGQFI